MVSEKKGAINAPKKVPTDKMETIRDDSPEVNLRSEGGNNLAPLDRGKCSSTYGIAMIPEMVPVSYPKSKPPKAANNPTKIPIQVEPAFFSPTLTYFLKRALSSKPISRGCFGVSLQR